MTENILEKKVYSVAIFIFEMLLLNYRYMKECRDLIEMLRIKPENNEKYQAENKEK